MTPWYRSPAYWRAFRRGFLLGNAAGFAIFGIGFFVHGFASPPGWRAAGEGLLGLLFIALSMGTWYGYTLETYP